MDGDKVDKRVRLEFIEILEGLILNGTEGICFRDFPQISHDVFDALAIFLQLFNVIDKEIYQETGCLIPITEHAVFFLKSFKVYLDEELDLIANWEHPGDRINATPASMLTWGLQFLQTMEKRRVEQLRSDLTLNTVTIALLLIKAEFIDDDKARFLSEYNLSTQSYQLVGGYHKAESIEETIQRNLDEDIPLTQLVLDKDVQFQKIGDDIYSERIATQKGVYTSYQIKLYHLIINKEKITLSGKERWLTLDELMQGRANDGKPIISPFKDTDNIDALTATFTELENSFPKKLKLPQYMIENEKKLKEKESEYRSLLELEEGENLEFKSSARWDYKAEKINKELGKTVAKTISGFMNSAGGYLIIGVNDKNEILGIGRDLQTLQKKNEDGFQLLIMSLISDFIGKEYTSFSEIHFEIIESKVICIIKVKRSTQPVFFRDGESRDFYVRTGNSTRQLNPQEAYRYIKFNWE